jgi:alkylated DNA repair dioxygenase AlkB
MQEQTEVKMEKSPEKINIKMKPEVNKIPLKYKIVMQIPLSITPQNEPVALHTPYSYYPNFYDKAGTEIKLIIEHLATLPHIYTYYQMFGKFCRSPRRMLWFADDPKWTYVFSHNHIGGLPVNTWTPQLLKIKAKVEIFTGKKFNSCLVNEYQSGDSIAWHHDNDPWFGDNFIVPSLSFGAEMDFKLRKKTDNNQQLSIKLENGSALFMDEECQPNWQHCIPKQSSVKGVRYNLTFRCIQPHLVSKQSKGKKMDPVTLTSNILGYNQSK